MKGLFIYVDGGKGHYVPAKAVETEFKKLGYETEFEEFFDYLDIKIIGKINKWWWRKMLHNSKLERKLSKHNDAESNGMEVATKLAVKHCSRVLKSNLEEERVDFIFATHPYASTIIAEMLFNLGLNIPVYYYATDVFNVPKASISNKLKKFLISTEMGKENAIRMGENKDLVKIVPFPLQQEIQGKTFESKAKVREKLGLIPDKFTLQLNLGGEGIGSLEVLDKIVENKLPIQIVLIGGFDNKQKEKLEKRYTENKLENTKVYVRGFVNNVSEYLYTSDIVMGRAGINTILEAIYMHRPFLITELVYTVIPSSTYVEENKIGWNATDNPNKAYEIIESLIRDSSILEKMDKNFDALEIIFGADKLASYLLEDLKIENK